MIIAVFAKRRQTKEGKVFYNYLATLKKKDGTDFPVRLFFREDCGAPKADRCPMNIEVAKSDMNMTKREYIREDTGEVGISFQVWVSKWSEGPEYVDHSMDEFEE